MTTKTEAQFAAMKERMRRERAAAQAIVDQALACEPVRLELVKGPRTKLITRGTVPEEPYRITDFDAMGPSGHRGYTGRESGIYSLTDEVRGALRDGYTVKVRPYSARVAS